MNIVEAVAGRCPTAPAGALIPSSRADVVREPSANTRQVITYTVAGVWAILALVSFTKIRAMNLYTRGGYEDVKLAARFDPGSFRIQMRAAEIQTARGQCRLAYHNAMQARGLFPHSSAAQQAVARCGNGQP